MAEAIPAAGGMPPAELLKAHFGPTRGEMIGIGEAGNAYDPAIRSAAARRSGS